MNTNPDDLFEYITGGKVDDAVIAKITRELEDPDSDVSRMVAAVREVSRRTTIVDWSQFASQGVDCSSSVDDQEEPYPDYLSRVAWALRIKEHDRELCALTELEIGRIREHPELHTEKTVDALAIIAKAFAGRDLRDNAVRVYEHLVWVARRVQPPMSIASVLANVATDLRHLGDLATSRSYFEEALSIARSQFPPDDDEVLLMQTNYAQLKSQLGFLNLAAQDYSDICAKLRGKERVDHQLLGDAEQFLGDVLQRSGDFRDAERAYRDSLADYERADAHAAFERTIVHCKLGSALLSLGDHEAAASQFHTARQLSKGDPAAYARTVMAITLAYHSAELLAQARAGYEEWLSLLSPSLGSDHPVKLYLLSHIGCLALELNQNSEAKTYLRNVLDVMPSNDVTRGVLTNNLGLALLRLGELNEGDRVLTEALARAPEGGSDRLRVLSNLSNCKLQQNDLTSAADYAEAAVALGRQLAATEGQTNLGIALNNLAVVKARTGDSHTAERLFDEAIAALEGAPRYSGLLELARLNRHDVWRPNFAPHVMEAIGKRHLDTAMV